MKYWTHWEGRDYRSEEFDTLLEVVYRMANNEDRGGPNCMASEEGTFYYPNNREGLGLYLRSSNEDILNWRDFTKETVNITPLGRKFDDCDALQWHTKHGPGEVTKCYFEDGNIIVEVEGSLEEYNKKLAELKKQYDMEIKI